MIGRILRQRKGITLVETIVAFTLLCVLIALTGTLLLSSLNTFGSGARQAVAHALGTSAYDFIKDRLAYAKALEIGADEKGYEKSLYAQDGMLWYDDGSGGDPLNVLGEDSFAGTTISYETSVSGFTLTLRVTVSWKGRALYERHGAFRLMNLEEIPESVIYGQTTTQSDPQIYFR